MEKKSELETFMKTLQETHLTFNDYECQEYEKHIYRTI